MRITIRTILFGLICCVQFMSTNAQQLMTNVYGRNRQLLNGKWAAIIDPYRHGHKNSIYKDKPLKSQFDFKEYSWNGGLRLNVPGDWNSQMPELNYYEGTIWYAKRFNVIKNPERRLFIYFGAVNYLCSIYLNGKQIGTHEGGFTPFQLEITDKIKQGNNFLVVEVDNSRRKDGIPALMYDWWNYGGITRDVMLITTPKTFIENYFIRLDKKNPCLIHADIKLSEHKANERIHLTIPKLKISQTIITDTVGAAKISINAKHVNRWSPTAPYLYEVQLSTVCDTIKELIGFRNIYTHGKQIYLNDNPIFIKGISFHEEIAQRKGRAYSEQDAVALLSEAKALGANLVRLAHYPQNEYIVRMAERMGIMLWEEIPLWQNIDFGSEQTLQKAIYMQNEMIMRDRNRCAVSFWGLANETAPSAARNSFLKHLAKNCLKLDASRLTTAAFDKITWDEPTLTFYLDDPVTEFIDVVSINKYMGWYHKWPTKPANIHWDVCQQKPLVISEFGGEALYGQTGEYPNDWSEDYQAQLYKDNLEMFSHITNLAGISPWVLFDFRSPYRFQPLNQNGWNRKGLVSDQGFRKKAWYIMNDFYNKR